MPHLPTQKEKTRREQESPSTMCRKLREGDILKFVSEIMHEGVE
jgi:hypothetical protein